MNMQRVYLAILACVIAVPVWADTPTEAEAATRINAANELVREGKIDEALAAYQSVSPAPSLKNKLEYNLAVARYRSGDVESAKTSFSKVAESTDDVLAAAARYNLGNCFYADAVSVAEQDKPAAIEALKQAIGHYRGSLSGDPNHVDARANIELAVELIKKLKQEQEQQQQENQQEQESQQQKQEEQQHEDQQEREDQQRQEDQQQQGDEQQQEDQQEQGSDSKENESQRGEQQQNQDVASETENDPQDQDADQNRPQPSQSDPQANDSRPQQDVEPSATEEEASQDEQTPVPSGELKPASEQDADEQPSGSIATEGAELSDAPMSKEEAMKMLQAVRDRDMLRRLRHEQTERRRHVPTDRDW